MSVFVDTSAFYAFVVRTEDSHGAVRETFADLLGAGRPLWTSSFVIVETMALLQHRIGLAAARDFDEEVLPVLRVHWVDERLYRLGTERLWRTDRRRVSLVDSVSLEFMKREGIRTALALDPHFREAGFEIVPTARTARGEE
ncbi:MAG TPA: PIN domain-containing protein [Vicinamibacterales bacterium]|nr:PIN domain-containing protein [Vicinamibacterales bacterium]